MNFRDYQENGETKTETTYSYSEWLLPHLPYLDVIGVDVTLFLQTLSGNPS